MSAAAVVVVLSVHRNCETGAVEYPAMDKRCEAVTLQGQVRRANALKNPGQPDCAARAP
jgi:hypothetical protein